MTFFYSLFEKVFSKRIQQKINNESYKALENYKNTKYEEKRQSELFDMEMLVGKPVISISNEWDNPIIGFVKKIDFISKAQNPVFIIHDYVNNEEVMVLGITYGYTEQRFNALMKLDPFETCSLIFQNYCSSSLKPFEKVKSGVRDTKENIIQKLQKNGFYNLLKLIENNK